MRPISGAPRALTNTQGKKLLYMKKQTLSRSKSTNTTENG